MDIRVTKPKPEPTTPSPYITGIPKDDLFPKIWNKLCSFVTKLVKR